MIATPAELEAWRVRCGFPNWEAAAVALGVSRRTMFRQLAAAQIDRTIALAAEAVETRLNGGKTP